MPNINSIPGAIIVEFPKAHNHFINTTGIDSNLHQHHEIVRQYFDAPSFNFILYTNHLQTMPRGGMASLFVEGTGEIIGSSRIRNAIMEYGVAIYMELVHQRLIIGDVFPAVIETIYHDAITFVLDREFIAKHSS
jgi:hypothetical protein